MSPTPIASVTRPRAPALFELRTERRLAAAGLTRYEDALDARPSEVDPPLGRPFHEVGGVGRREHRSFRAEELDDLQQPLGVARADRNVTEADTVEGGERRPGHEGTSVVGGDDALPGDDARGRVAARRGRHPVVEIAGRKRDEAGRAGGTARRVDPDDLGRRRAQMRADGILRRARRPELTLVGEGQLRDVPEPTRLGRGVEPCGCQFLAIER